MHSYVTRYSCRWVKWGRFDSYGREVLSGDFLLQKSLSSGSGDRRFRRKRKRGFMDLTACWAGDLSVQFHLFLVVAGHPFQESCKRRTAVLAEVGSVLVGHSCSLRDKYLSAVSRWTAAFQVPLGRFRTGRASSESSVHGSALRNRWSYAVRGMRMKINYFR
jgi:hypothetical protein